MFTTNGVSGVKNFKYMSWNFVLYLWADKSDLMALLMVFNL